MVHASISVPLTAALLSEFGRWEKPHLACHLNEAFSTGMLQHWAMLSFSVLCGSRMALVYLESVLGFQASSVRTPTFLCIWHRLCTGSITEQAFDSCLRISNIRV